LVLLEEGHVGRAAERLAITPSDLAEATRSLEGDLGVALFTRSSPEVAPTTAGERFADQVRPLLGELELATAEARRAAGVGMPLRIGCAPDLPLQRLQGFLGGLYSRQPELQATVAYLRTAEQIRRLRTGQLDLGLIHHAGDNEGIAVEPIFHGEPLVGFLPIGHPLAEADTITAGDLLKGEHVLVVAPRHADPALADCLVTRLSTAGHDVRDVQEAVGEDPRTLLLAVAERGWIAIEPMSTLAVVGDIASLVTTRPLDPPVRMPDTALAWRVNAPPELDAIMSLARGSARRLYTVASGGDPQARWRSDAEPS
jgi:DNA-binding transcriptional LysR family regulator